jgi:arylsulfatase A-like enzyme
LLGDWLTACPRVQDINKEASDKSLNPKGLGWGIGFFMIFQYASSLWRLAHSTGGMDDKFSKLAREEYRAFLVWENVKMIPAYLLLGLAAWLILFPGFSRLRGKPWMQSRLFGIVSGFGLTLLMHGFFMMRLVYTRPYFLSGSQFGGWYASLLESLPEGWKPFIQKGIFVSLPLVLLACVGLWWARRLWQNSRRSFVAILAVLVVVGLVMAAPHLQVMKSTNGATVGKRWNVLIIGSDSLRGDRLGATGYWPSVNTGAAAGGVSPNIDAWAAHAYRFAHCYTPIASTLESTFGSMTSTYPHTNGFRHMYPQRETLQQAESKTVPIASVLEKEGYDTAAIGDWCAGIYKVSPLGFKDVSVSSFDNFKIYMSQAVVMAHFVVPLYYDNALGYRLFPQIESFAQFVTPDVVTMRVQDKIAQQAQTGRPFFWHVFYSCNHLPYRSRDPYCRLFSDPAYQGPNAHEVAFDIEQFISGTDLESKWKAISETEIQQIRSLYDGCTRQFDDCFGRIVESLKKHGLYENTIIIVNADHGDDLYEPGVTLSHGLGFNGADHCFNPAFCIRVPGLAGAEMPQQIRNIDVSPTLLGLLGVKAPAGWEGHDFSSWLTGTATPKDLPFYGETSFPFIQFKVPGVERPPLPAMDELTYIQPSFNYQFVLKPEYEAPLIQAKQRCLRTRDWKIVCTPTSDGGRHFGLFHVKQDKDCREDLSGRRPEVLAPMQKALVRWMDEHHETFIEEIFPAGEPAS